MLLKLGANPDRVNPGGLVPLNVAGADVDLIKVLLKYGANVNAGTKGVLMSAIETGDVDILRIYLENGADCNEADQSSDSQRISWLPPRLLNRYPLLKAVLPPLHGGWPSEAAVKMVDLLLDHGAKVDHPLSPGETLIHCIFRYTPTSMLPPFLHRHEIDFNLRDQEGRTVFMSACESHITFEPDFKQPLVPKEGHSKEDYIPAYLALADSELHGSTIDYLATDKKGHHIINYLIPHWSDETAERFLPIPGVRDLVTQKDFAGFSPLHHALKMHKSSACLGFLKGGSSNLVEADPNGDTALHHIFRCPQTDLLPDYQPLMIRYLELGGEIDKLNKSGDAALHVMLALHWSPSSSDRVVSGREQFDPLAFFVDHGANLQAVKSTGETALHVIARRNVGNGPPVSEHGQKQLEYNTVLFKKLVALGCDPLQEDVKGRTALDVAAAIGNEGILKLYRRKK